MLAAFSFSETLLVSYHKITVVFIFHAVWEYTIDSIGAINDI